MKVNFFYKLKLLRNKISEWNKEIFGDMTIEIKDLEDQIIHLTSNDMSRPFFESQEDSLCDLKNRLKRWRLHGEFGIINQGSNGHY